MSLSTTTTHGVTVSVLTQYLPEHSAPRRGEFIFGYRINIQNDSPYTIQLLERHWIIVGSDGFVREVQGEGVVGQFPVLQPGEGYEYTSYCDLHTEMGKMFGTYRMVRQADQVSFLVDIPEFRMVAPFKLN